MNWSGSSFACGSARQVDLSTHWSTKTRTEGHDQAVTTELNRSRAWVGFFHDLGASVPGGCFSYQSPLPDPIATDRRGDHVGLVTQVDVVRLPRVEEIPHREGAEVGGAAEAGR